MALYKRDFNLINAKQFIENLDDSDDNKHIKYYINHLEDINKEQREKIKEYQDFFNKLNKFLPNNNPIFG